MKEKIKIMKSIRLALLLFIGFWIFWALADGPPDTVSTMQAYERYAQNPSKETRRAAEDSLKRDNRTWQLARVGPKTVVLILAIYGFIRAGRVLKKRAPNQSPQTTTGSAAPSRV